MTRGAWVIVDLVSGKSVAGTVTGLDAETVTVSGNGGRHVLVRSNIKHVTSFGVPR